MRDEQSNQDARPRASERVAQQAREGAIAAIGDLPVRDREQAIKVASDARGAAAFEALRCIDFAGVGFDAGSVYERIKASAAEILDMNRTGAAEEIQKYIQVAAGQAMKNIAEQVLARLDALEARVGGGE